MLSEKEYDEQTMDLVKGLRELGFSDEEIQKALSIDKIEDSNSDNENRDNLVSEIEELEKALSKKKEMLKTIDGEDSESLDKEETEEDEDEDVVEKSIKNHFDNFTQRFERMIEEANETKQREVESLIKSLESKIEETSNKLSQLTKYPVDRRPFTNVNFIEKGEKTEDGDSIVSLSRNKEDILKGLEDMMEKSVGSDKDHIGQQIIKFNASNVCDPRTLLKLSSVNKWKLVE